MFDAQKFERYAVAPHGRLKAQKIAIAAADGGPVTATEERAAKTMTFERVLDRAIAKAHWSRLALRQAAKRRLSDIARDKTNTFRIRSLRYWIAQQEAADISVVTLIAFRENLLSAWLGQRGRQAPVDVSFATPASDIEGLLEGRPEERLLAYEHAVEASFAIRARIHSLISSPGIPDTEMLDGLCCERDSADSALTDIARVLT
jgi:hypothetical protein